MSLPLRIGLPAWAYAGWAGTYLQARPSLLSSYATVFDAVEGNTSFYATPSAQNVARWTRAVEGTDLRFSFKLPSAITHASARPGQPLALAPDPTALQTFFDAVAPLAAHLGPFLVQFPARIGPSQLDELHTLFSNLPRYHDYAVEVRHPAFFQQPEPLEMLLSKHAAARVMMDTRALFGGDPDHPDVRAARHEKPDVPLVDRVSGNHAFIRLVLHPNMAENLRVIDEWVRRIPEWLLSGVAVTLMVHCPNNQYCPPFARVIHDRLCRHDSLAGRLEPLPPWPIPQQIEMPL